MDWWHILLGTPYEISLISIKPWQLEMVSANLDAAAEMVAGQVYVSLAAADVVAAAGSMSSLISSVIRPDW